VAELLIDPGDQIGLAHAAGMARHLSSFSGPAISSPDTIAGVEASLAQLPAKACMASARASDNFPAAHPMAACNCFNADALCQGQMAAGHGGLLTGAWHCQLGQNPTLSF